MNNTDIERIEFTCTAGGSVKTTHRTRAANRRITGVCLVSHSGDSAVTGTKMKVSVDKEQLFSSDFDPSILAFSQSTPNDARFHDYINREIHQSDIDIEFTDKATGAGGVFVLLLKCEQDG